MVPELFCCWLTGTSQCQKTQANKSTHFDGDFPHTTADHANGKLTQPVRASAQWQHATNQLPIMPYLRHGRPNPPVYSDSPKYSAGPQTIANFPPPTFSPSCVLDFATAGIGAYTGINFQALSMHALTMSTPLKEC